MMRMHLLGLHWAVADTDNDATSWKVSKTLHSTTRRSYPEFDFDDDSDIDVV